MKEYFEAKKAELLEEKGKIEAEDFSEKIAEEVNEFRAIKKQEIEDFIAATEKKYSDIKAENAKKVDYYLEFIDSELAKIAEKEQEPAEVVESVVQEEVSAEIPVVQE